MQKKKVLIHLTSEGKYFSEPRRKMYLKLPSQRSGSIGWSGSYSNWMLMTSLSSIYRILQEFRADASLEIY